MWEWRKIERGFDVNREIKLHLGCGERYIPEFIHIDLADYPHIDYKRDISDLSIFKDNSVDLIYCCHALEYFDREEVRKVLKEWYRVLRKSGILRVAVPDFEAIVKVYLKYKDLNHRGILGPLYGRMVIKTPEGEKIIYHKTVYDFKSLKDVLESVGFKNIHRYDWCETIHRDYDDFSQAYIPHMDKEKGILISLNVEAEK
jgi:predicted SAM-dependent methyltransferase